jgi:hypothetical protein
VLYTHSLAKIKRLDDSVSPGAPCHGQRRAARLCPVAFKIIQNTGRMTNGQILQKGVVSSGANFLKHPMMKPKNHPQSNHSQNSP